MFVKKSLPEIISEWKLNHDFKENIVNWQTIEEKPAQAFFQRIHQTQLLFFVTKF